MDGDGVIRGFNERQPWQDTEHLISLTGDLGANFSTLFRTGVAVGRCLQDNCPAGQVQMTFTEGRHADWIPKDIAQFACPVCGERLRVDCVYVRAVPDGDDRP